MKLPKGWGRVAMNALGSVQAGRQRSPHHITGALRITSVLPMFKMGGSTFVR